MEHRQGLTRRMLLRFVVLAPVAWLLGHCGMSKVTPGPTPPTPEQAWNDFDRKYPAGTYRRLYGGLEESQLSRLIMEDMSLIDGLLKYPGGAKHLASPKGKWRRLHPPAVVKRGAQQP